MSKNSRSVGDEIREQRQKLKGQGFKAHWDYFWEYYKIHVIVGVVVIIFVATLIHDIGSNKPYSLYAMLINSATLDGQERLEDGFAEYAGLDTENYRCFIDTSTTFRTDVLDETAIATIEKIMAVISSNELDVIVGDENVFVYYSYQDAFRDLRELYTDDELAALGDKVVYVDRSFIEYLDSDEYTDYLTSGEYDHENKYAVMAAKNKETLSYESVPVSKMENPIPVGIKLDSSAVLLDAEAYTGVTPIAGFLVTSQRTDTAKEFVKYLLLHV